MKKKYTKKQIEQAEAKWKDNIKLIAFIALIFLAVMLMIRIW